MRKRMDSRTRLVLPLMLLVLAPRPSSAQGVPSPWTATNIGAPPASGSTSFERGTFSITSTSGDIWERSDQFHFVYQQIAGDVEIIARVNAFSPAGAWSKLG